MRKFLLLLMVFLAPPALAADWKAGAARVSITPEKMMWMSGYGARNKPADSQLSDLYAKAVAIEDPAGHRLLLVTMDLVGIHRDLALRVRSRLEAKHKLQRANVALSTSHTHSGPVVGSNLRSMYALDDAQNKLIDDYTAALEEKLVAVGNEAMAKLAPAMLEWGIGSAAFAVNRRANVEKNVPELLAAGKTLAGPVDHDLPLLVIRDSAGKPVSIVFGYACHATVLSGYAWSGDWPGYAQSEIERNNPGAVAMFVAGCGADQNPLPRRTVELAQSYGQKAATGVANAMKAGLKKIDGELSAAYGEVELPFADLPTKEQWTSLLESKNSYEVRRAKLMLAQMEGNKPLPRTYPYPVQAWKLGPDLKWILLGGEVVVDYSLRLKREIGKETWVSGYCNDVMAYIPSLRVLKEGGYEGGGSMVYYGLPAPWGPEVEERVVNEARRLAGGK